MDDDLRSNLLLYLGPGEVALVEKYLAQGELCGYELLLPREWALRYVDEAAQRGLVVLGVDFFMVTAGRRQPIYYTTYSDHCTGDDAVEKCRALAQKDLDQWPGNANFAALTLRG